MDQCESYCPYLLPSETTAKGTVLENKAGKEDPLELDFSLSLWVDLVGVVVCGSVSIHETPQPLSLICLSLSTFCMEMDVCLFVEKH